MQRGFAAPHRYGALGGIVRIRACPLKGSFVVVVLASPGRSPTTAGVGFFERAGVFVIPMRLRPSRPCPHKKRHADNACREFQCAYGPPAPALLHLTRRVFECEEGGKQGRASSQNVDVALRLKGRPVAPGRRVAPGFTPGPCAATPPPGRGRRRRRHGGGSPSRARAHRRRRAPSPGCPRGG